MNETLKVLIGRAAELAFPNLARRIDRPASTAPVARLKSAILRARLARAKSKGDVAGIESTLAAFWRGDGGGRFHDRHADIRFQLFRDRHAGVIDALADVLDGAEAGFSRLVEIGCGDGAVLAYCAERLPQLSEMIGLDINAAVIARSNAGRRQGGRTIFVNAEAGTWLEASPQPGTVLLSNGGVLEYLSEESFDSLLQALARATPAAIALIEPVAVHHDLERQADSFVFGNENSFSHNHRRRLENAGFQVAFEEAAATPGIRWMLMIGLKF